MTATWLYTVIDGIDMRYPFDLRTRSIDWLHGEPYSETPLMTVVIPRIKREYSTPEHKRRMCRERVRKWRAAQAQKSARR